MSMLDKVKDLFGGSTGIEISDDYVELEADMEKREKAKILIKLFNLNEFEDIKSILDAIREGYTISVINIQPLKEKDMISLKRAIDKLKKTVEANEGDIAGLAENLLIATPSFACVHRGEKREEEHPEPTTETPSEVME